MDAEFTAAMDRIEVRNAPPGEPHTVRYFGSRSDLVTACIAQESWFPREGRKRRQSGADVPHQCPDYWCVSDRGEGRFSVARWRFWNDPEGAAAERERIERLRDVSRGIEARRREAFDSRRPATVAELVQRAQDSFVRVADLLIQGVEVSPIMRLKVDSADRYAASLVQLAREIRHAPIRPRWIAISGNPSDS
jgi:hypothetical protein